MKNITRLIRRLFQRDERLNFIHNLTIYPEKMEGNQFDPRMDYNKPYMIVCFDYIQEPETDERIIKAVEDKFNDLPEFEDMKIKPVREIITTRQEITTSFKERMSLN